MHAALVPRRSSLGKERVMLDLIMLAIGLSFFALSVGYAYVTERL
jgi:hypothetical protein